MPYATELMSHRSDLIGGIVTHWEPFPPMPPITAKIVDIRRKQYDDYTSIQIETTEFESVVPGGPIGRTKDLEFQEMPGPTSVVNAGPGLWAIVAPRGGVAILQALPR